MRGDDETYPIWWDKFILSIPRIESGNGFADFDFIKMPLHDTIHGCGFNSFRHFSFGFQKRRMEFGYDGQIIMIRVAQHQHGCSFLRLAWNPGITLFGNSATDKDETASFYFQEFTLVVHWIGFLKEQFSEWLTEFLEYLIALLIGSIQEASCVSTLQDSALSSGCFTSSKMVWDSGIILNFSLVQLVDRKVIMALLEDKQSLGREDCNVPIFGFSCSASGDDFRGCVNLIGGVI
jgi:hypothetical protein